LGERKQSNLRALIRETTRRDLPVSDGIVLRLPAAVLTLLSKSY